MIYLVMLRTGRGMDKSTQPLRAFIPSDYIPYLAAEKTAKSFVEAETARIKLAVEKWNRVQNDLLMDGGWIEKNPAPTGGGMDEFDEYDARYAAEEKRLNAMYNLVEGDKPLGAEDGFEVYVVEVASGSELSKAR